MVYATASILQQYNTTYTLYRFCLSTLHIVRTVLLLERYVVYYTFIIGSNNTAYNTT